LEVGIREGLREITRKSLVAFLSVADGPLSAILYDKKTSRLYYRKYHAKQVARVPVVRGRIAAALANVIENIDCGQVRACQFITIFSESGFYVGDPGPRHRWSVGLPCGGR